MEKGDQRDLDRPNAAVGRQRRIQRSFLVPVGVGHDGMLDLCPKTIVRMVMSMVVIVVMFVVVSMSKLVTILMVVLMVFVLV